MFSTLQDIYQTYFNKRVLIMLALGFASGFPFLLVFNTLSLWLKDVNFSYAAIGAFSLVKMPYALKFLFSPIIDGAKLPLLWRMGRRRSWAVLAQICLFAALIAMSRWTPDMPVMYLAACALLVSFFSAALDIVLDAFRVEIFAATPDDQASGAAVFVAGYRIGLLFSGAFALSLANFISWNTVYIVMSTGVIVGLVTIFCVKEPAAFSYHNDAHQSFHEFISERVIAPIKDFAHHQNWKLILCLIFIYRLSDAYVGPMAYPFYDDMGFSKLEIAYIIKIYGMAATILGGLYGGVFLKKIGLYRGLYICCFLQGITTAFYAVQAYVGHSVPLLTLTISLENFSSGMATAALVAYMSSLCNIAYTATQYALLSSLMSLARDFFAATSGWLLEQTSWPIFFILAGLMSLPAALIVKKLDTLPAKNT